MIPMIGAKDHQPSKEQQFQMFVRTQLYNQDMGLLNLQNNFVALKNLTKISDEQLQGELKRMAAELDEKNKPVVSEETRATVEALAAEVTE